MNILDYAKGAEPCQRNWDYSQLIPEQDIEYITKVCTTMPTRRNLNTYQLHVVTDRDTISKIYNIAYNPDDYKKTFLLNSQASAPLLLVWSASIEYHALNTDVSFAVGISSAAAAFAAVELGYKTGFCKCFDRQTLKGILKTGGKKFEAEPMLMLGIGHPNDDLAHNVVLRPDGSAVSKESRSGKKNIKITKI